MEEPVRERADSGIQHTRRRALLRCEFVRVGGYEVELPRPVRVADQRYILTCATPRPVSRSNGTLEQYIYSSFKMVLPSGASAPATYVCKSTSLACAQRTQPIHKAAISSDLCGALAAPPLPSPLELPHHQADACPASIPLRMRPSLQRSVYQVRPFLLRNDYALLISASHRH